MGEEPTRLSLIEATRESLLRIALAFGMLNAVVPLLLAVLSGKPPLTLALGFAWAITWLVAVRHAVTFGELFEHSTRRWLLAAVGASATAATILATGGMSSPLANGANWLGWAATVVVSARVALAFAAVLGAGTVAAYAVASGSVAVMLDEEHRYTAVTGLLNPAIIVLVALALAGVFKAVVAASPGTLWRLREGEPASTPGLTALLDAPSRAPHGPPLGAAQESAGHGAASGLVLPARSPLDPDEAVVVALLADGLVPKEVARALGRSPDAVYRRIASAKARTGAESIEHLVALAWRPAT